MDKSRWLAYLVLGSLGIIGLGVFVWKGGFDPEPKIEIVHQAEKMIWVDVAGEVNKPGVYQLAGDARVDKALEAAGGLTGHADVEWVDKNLNRASKLNDGMKIFIPKKHDYNDQSSNPKSQESGKININTAGQSELESLVGVGPVIAGKIIAARPYARIEELVDKKVLSNKVFEQVKEQIAVW